MNRATVQIKLACRLYGVSRSGYYAWRGRSPSHRAKANSQLTEHIRQIHADSGQTYGSPRVYKKLRRQGHTAGRHRIARLMHKAGIRGRSADLYKSSPGMRAFYARVPNLTLDKAVTGINQVWVADLTYIHVAGKWTYLAAVMDLYSRKIVGWHLGTQKNVALTERALAKAVYNRRPPKGLIFHTDRGIEYCALQMQAQLNRWGMLASHNRPGKVTDNAHMESFFRTLKSDRIHGRSFVTQGELMKVLKDYINPFYNCSRLHSSLGYTSPHEYELQIAA